MDQVFHTDDTVLAKVVFDQLIIGESNSLLVNLAISSLVDELSDRLQVGIAVSDIWINNCEHLLSSLSESDKNAVVDLNESEKLKDLARLGCDLVDTLDADNKDQPGLLFNVEAAVLSTQSSKSDLFTLGIAILFDVGLGTLEDSFALLFVGLLALLELGTTLLTSLLLTLSLLQECLWDHDLVIGRHASGLTFISVWSEQDSIAESELQHTVHSQSGLFGLDEMSLISEMSAGGRLYISTIVCAQFSSDNALTKVRKPFAQSTPQAFTASYGQLLNSMSLKAEIVTSLSSTSHSCFLS